VRFIVGCIWWTNCPHRQLTLTARSCCVLGCWICLPKCDNSRNEVFHTSTGASLSSKARLKSATLLGDLAVMLLWVWPICPWYRCDLYLGGTQFHSRPENKVSCLRIFAVARFRAAAERSWRLRSPGLLRSVDWWFAAVFSEQNIGPIFNSQSVQKHCMAPENRTHTLFRNVGNQSLTYDAKHPRRAKTQFSIFSFCNTPLFNMRCQFMTLLHYHYRHHL
jgi:hypothetical protein